jgi:hypothetical protein
VSYEAPGGGDNPLLHMGQHIAVQKQIVIDRLSGIRAMLDQLQARSRLFAMS